MVWVYVGSGSSWTQQTGLSSGEQPTNTSFGFPLALSGDGNTAMVGARNFPIGSGTVRPRVMRVFVRSGTAWQQQDPIPAPSDDTGVPSAFGSSVALSGDGKIAFIGDPTDGAGVGAVWVFMRADSGWVQQGKKLTANNELGQGHFGGAISLSQNGDTALIGAGDDNHRSDRLQPAGAAWVFMRSGSTWTQGPKLVGQSNLNRRFGENVALTADGNRALVAGNGAVAAWAFARSGSTWKKESPWMLMPTPGIGRDDWGGGFGITMSADGATALLSGFLAGSLTVWPYRRTAHGWSQSGSKLTRTGGVWFGNSGALTPGGTTAFVSSVGGAGQGPGSVWAFQWFSR
jgi:FG-GAP repeat protein